MVQEFPGLLGCRGAGLGQGGHKDFCQDCAGRGTDEAKDDGKLSVGDKILSVIGQTLTGLRRPMAMSGLLTILELS